MMMACGAPVVFTKTRRRRNAHLVEEHVEGSLLRDVPLQVDSHQLAALGPVRGPEIGGEKKEKKNSQSIEHIIW
jgi:hypothetical protein